MSLCFAVATLCQSLTKDFSNCFSCHNFCDAEFCECHNLFTDCDDGLCHNALSACSCNSARHIFFIFFYNRIFYCHLNVLLDKFCFVQRMLFLILLLLLTASVIIVMKHGVFLRKTNLPVHEFICPNPYVHNIVTTLNVCSAFCAEKISERAPRVSVLIDSMSNKYIDLKQKLLSRFHTRNSTNAIIVCNDVQFALGILNQERYEKTIAIFLPGTYFSVKDIASLALIKTIFVLCETQTPNYSLTMLFDMLKRQKQNVTLMTVTQTSFYLPLQSYIEYNFHNE